jgi:zinc transport system substrate-binding protein
MLKRILTALTLIALIAPMFTACGPRKPPDGSTISIVATNFAGYDFARQIGIGFVSVKLLPPPGTNPQLFEPTEQDVIDIQNCDVFICVGGESEAWVDALLNDIDTKNIRIVKMADIVTQKSDEHVWINPRDAVTIVGVVTRALGYAEPYYRSYFLEKRDDYIYQLDKLDRTLGDVIFPSPCKTVVFGGSFPFRGLFEHYRLSYFAAFPDCDTDTAESRVSDATLTFLTDKVMEESLNTVFYTELSNRDAANAIAGATTATTAELHSMHNITEADFNAGVTYLDLQYRNVEALKAALYAAND